MMGAASMREEGIVSRYKLRALGVLLLVYAATLLGWSWPWGLFFLAMTAPAIRYRETCLVDHVTRAENPVIYWLIVSTWILLSLSLIGWDIGRWMWPDQFAEFMGTSAW